MSLFGHTSPSFSRLHGLSTAAVVGLLVTALVGQASAQPVVDAVSGNFNHKGTVVISGSGFGTKDPAPPRIWDATDDSSATDLDTHWPGDRLPRSCEDSGGTPGETPYLMAYRTEFHGFSEMPHARITKFISAAHTSCTSDGCAGNGVDNWCSWMADNLITTGPWNADTLFAMYYYRMSSTFSASAHPVDGENLKEASANGAPGTYLAGADTYIGWCGNGAPPVTYPNESFLPGRLLSGCSDANRVEVTNPMRQWIHLELLWNVTGFLLSGSDNASRTWSSAQIAEHSITHADGNNPAAISIGGYNRFPRASATGNYRYWAGLYLDDTYARVMLGNNPAWDACTVREPQIPSEWSVDSISAEVNLGALSDGQTAYLFVFDAQNNHNVPGFPVLVGPCTDGDTRPCYTGPDGTVDVGACEAGEQTCSAATWGDCLGETVPVAEDCEDGSDNDCDGQTDAEDSENCGEQPDGKASGGCSCQASGSGSPQRDAGLSLLLLSWCLLLGRRRRQVD